MRLATSIIRSDWQNSASQPSYSSPSPPEHAPAATVAKDGSPSMRVLIERFLSRLWAEAGLADNTLSAYRTDLESLADFCEQSGLVFQTLTPLDVQTFLVALRQERKLAVSSVARRLVAVKLFCRFAFQNGYLDRDLATLIETPKKWNYLPTVLNEHQIDTLVTLPDDGDPLMMRDRAILELFYATGLRVSELVSLRLGDVHLDVGYVRCMGKGSKERVVPVGSKAIEAVRDSAAAGSPRKSAPSLSISSSMNTGLFDPTFRSP